MHRVLGNSNFGSLHQRFRSAVCHMCFVLMVVLVFSFLVAALASQGGIPASQTGVLATQNGVMVSQNMPSWRARMASRPDGLMHWQAKTAFWTATRRPCWPEWRHGQ